MPISNTIPKFRQPRQLGGQQHLSPFYMTQLLMEIIECDQDPVDSQGGLQMYGRFMHMPDLTTSI